MCRDAQDVAVTFTDCDAGWVFCTVSRGEQAVEIHASEVFDPFPDLIAWLEAIAVGVEECAFEVDEEGGGKRLEYRRVWYDSFAFAMKDAREDGPVLLQGGIDPLQLVREFYEKLRAFARSPGYRKDQWEMETIGDRLARLSAPPRRRSEMVRDLLALDRTKLRARLFEIAPSYYITPPNTANGHGNWLRRVGRPLAPDDADLLRGCVQTPTEWYVPEDYDLWPRKRKAGFIVEYLSEGASVSSFDGTRLGDIRSRIIEDWMEKETRTRRRALRQK